MMKLYTSLTSPYGRIARIVRLEKGLADRIALHPVKTRGADNSYYAVNPSGRVPSLILNDGAVLEDSTLVCWFMDHLDGAPTLLPPEGMAGLEHRRIVFRKSERVRGPPPQLEKMIPARKVLGIEFAKTGKGLKRRHGVRTVADLPGTGEPFLRAQKRPGEPGLRLEKKNANRRVTTWSDRSWRAAA